MPDSHLFMDSEKEHIIHTSYLDHYAIIETEISYLFDLQFNHSNRTDQSEC